MGIKVLFIIPLAFLCEFMDSTLGMGYGTTLAPILILMGFEPLQVVPAILLSEFVTGISAAFFHHSVKNVSFNLRSNDTKVAFVLTIFSIIGVICSVLLAVKLPSKIVKLYISLIVLAMGIIIIATRNRQIRFTWRKIIAAGSIAAFNKGISGGGYGPVVMGGQMLSGIGVKNAVAITSLAEGVTCLVGIVVYFVTKSNVDWILAPWLMAGAVLSVPLSAHTLKKITEKKVKLAVGITIIALGCFTLIKVLF
ncbi:MAG: sulfite exporter TauE/SafE family protein [Candidatus Omnitrophota bacterium]